jgi:short-subunit dehydrogenase
METALITGASSGIGLELSKVFARNKINLVLVARNERMLIQLAEELRIDFEIDVNLIVKDLNEKNSCEEIYNELKQKRIEINYLINNAGFGDVGRLVSSKWIKQEKMIQVNITSLTHLTRLFLPDMFRRDRGRIMNVASTAAFQPGPLMSVYYATKAYVLSFTEAISDEVKGSKVTATALCPGPTLSNFQKSASAEKINLFQRNMHTSKEVAEFGFKAMMKGKRVAVYGLVNKTFAFFVKFVPRFITLFIVRKLNEAKGNNN